MRIHPDNLDSLAAELTDALPDAKIWLVQRTHRGVAVSEPVVIVSETADTATQYAMRVIGDNPHTPLGGVLQEGDGLAVSYYTDYHCRCEKCLRERHG